MEGIGTGLGQNARVVFVMELKVQKLPCFARRRCFCVLEGLRVQQFMFLAQGNAQNSFQKFARVGSLRYASCVDFCTFLGYEAKGEK